MSDLVRLGRGIDPLPDSLTLAEPMARDEAAATGCNGIGSDQDIDAAYPAFLSKFGIPDSTGVKQIPSSWHNGISGATNVGEILGLQLAGPVSERYGYRYTIIAALVAITGFIFIPFYAESLTIFLVGELFQGIAWGVFQTMTTAYAAEVCPVPLRHYLTTYVNLCWIIGQFISAGLPPRSRPQDRRVGLQDSFRRPMGMAHPYRHWMLSRPGVAVVVRPAWS